MDEQTLFCTGIPGAGKTILTSIVVDHLYSKCEIDPSIGIAYIYCNFRRNDEQKIDDLLASLLKQFIQERSSVPESVKALYNQHRNKRTRPPLNETSKILTSVITYYSRAYIVVDALDECQLSNGCRSTFLSTIFNIQAKTGAKVFATSRLIPDIKELFKGCLSLEILASDEDVGKYLNGRMSQHSTRVLRKPELQEEITTQIVQAVEGMFLLAQLYLGSLEDKTTVKAVKTALKQFQKKSQAASEDKKLEVLSSAYEQAMKRINGQQAGLQLLTNNVLLWITCAKRPLSTMELQHAIAVEINKSEFDKDNLTEIEDIVSVCAGLVTIDQESGVIRLVHYTTQEYFELTQREWFPGAQTNITMKCITYLSFNEFESGICQSDEELEQRLQSNKFYDYAAHNWGYHAREASTLCQGIIEFLQKQEQVEASSQVLIAVKQWSGHENYSQEIPKQMTGLHLAAYFGIEDAVQFLLSSHSPDPKDSYSCTPLHWASYNGHLEVAQLLLDKGADVNTANINGGTPLHRASYNNHLEVAQLLLNKGADVNAADINREMSLHWASYNNQLEVTQLLLDKGADVNAANINGGTPLYRASYKNHLEVAQLLLNKGADVNAANINGGTPLHWASYDGHLEVAQLLLSKGADINAADKHGETPLYRASYNGHLEVAQLLLSKGADVNAADKDGETPLYRASYNGHLEVAQLLLSKGADVNAANKDGETPLHWASYNGHLEVAQLLLNKGADVEVEDSVSRTPLLYAAKNGNKATVELLIATNRVNVDSRDYYDSTPLSVATRMG